MPQPYARSIFAVELNQVLQERKLDMSVLRRVPLALESKTVERLITSLTNLKPLTGLNREDIITVVKGLHLSQDDYLRIYAALVALGVQRLMLDYLPPERAWQVADEVRKEVLEAQRRNPDLGMDFLTRRITSNVSMSTEAQPSEGISSVFDDALDNFDQGVVLATLGALETDAEDGQLLLAQAPIYLERAKQFLENLSPSIRRTEDWIYWHEQVEKQLENVEEISG